MSASADASSSSAFSSSPEMSLSQKFLYQHAQTGQISASPLSCAQIVKILTRSDVIARVLPLLQGKGEAEGELGGYGEWSSPKETPILRLCLYKPQWHCTLVEEQRSGKATPRGPMSVLQLAKLASSSAIQQVYCAERSPAWAPVDEEVKLCLEALQPPKQKPNETTAPEPQSQPDEQQPHEHSEAVQDELEAFLTNTVGGGSRNPDDDDDDDNASFTSDNGTRYVKDPRHHDKWIHEALAAVAPIPSKSNHKSSIKLNKKGSTKPESKQHPQQQDGTNKKRKRSKFNASNAKNWIYVTGLPLDVTFEEVATFFRKVGILELDPETQQPKIKLYSSGSPDNKQQHQSQQPQQQRQKLKGDASICYARTESVDLALQVLDDTPFRFGVPDQRIKVERAKFKQKGDTYMPPKKQSLKKKAVAKLAAEQNLGWDEDTNGRITGGKKGLCIVVVKGLFTLEDILGFSPEKEDEFLESVETGLRKLIDPNAIIEKLTFFSKHPDGVAILKFAQASAASRAVEQLNGTAFGQGHKLHVKFWDGVTDYTVVDDEQEKKEMEKRHEEFGNWLEKQDLPEEFRLQVES